MCDDDPSISLDFALRQESSITDEDHLSFISFVFIIFLLLSSYARRSIIFMKDFNYDLKTADV